MSSKSLSTTSQASVAPNKSALDSKLKHSNNNSIDATNLQDEIDNSVDDNQGGVQTFLTVEAVSAIIDRAMKKQRSDIKILAKC